MRLREFGSGTIVIRLPNWVGDAVMATAALRSIRAAVPQAEIVLMGPPAVERLYRGLQSFDRYLPFRKSSTHRGISGMWHAAREIRRLGAQLAILFPHSVSSALLFRLARVPRVFGYRSWERGWLLTQGPKPPLDKGRRIPEPMTVHYMKLLRDLGVESCGEELELHASEKEIEESNQQLQQLGVGLEDEFFAINPGASFGSSKLWTVAGFVKTIAGLHEEYGLRSIVLCGPGEESLAHEIARGAGAAAVDTSSNMISLQHLKPLLKRAKLLITTDAGPRHIATAFQRPVAVLMGSTDPRYTNSNLGHTKILRSGVDCSPCHLKVCPIDHRCMTRIDAGHVLAAVRELLTRSGAGGQEFENAEFHCT